MVLQTKANALNKQKMPMKMKGKKSFDAMDFEDMNSKDQRRCRSLCIGNLPSDIKEKELKALSSDILEVEFSRKKQGYAFLVFENLSKAEENFNILQKKKLRNSDFILDFCEESKRQFSKYNKDEKSQRKHRTLLISNLPPDIEKADLKALSSDILEVDFPKKPRKMYAFLVFENLSKAEENFNILQKKKLRNSDFILDFCEKSKRYKDQRMCRSLSIGNLPSDIEEAELKALSSDILEVDFPEKRQGCAFLVFENVSKAEENFNILQKKKLRNSDFILDFCEESKRQFREYKDKKSQRRCRRLYVGNLPSDIEKAELKALSSDILEVDFPKKTYGEMYAFLVFENLSKAEENFNILQKKKLRNSDFILDFCDESKRQFRKYNEDEKIQRRCRTLYIGNLPSDIEEAELKALSSDILEVYFRGRKQWCAFLVFENVSKAEENFNILQKKKLRNSDFILDFCEESKRQFREYKDKKIPRRCRSLYIGNLPSDIEEAELKALSSDILKVDFPKKTHAFLLFENLSKAEENFNILQKKKLHNSDFKLDFCGKSKIPLEEKVERIPRRCRSLCIGNLPSDIEEAELKALSSDILEVDFPEKKQGHAFLVFVNPSKAEANFNILQKKKLRNSDFILNFCNKRKSQLTKEKGKDEKKYVETCEESKRQNQEIDKLNNKTLCITGLPMDTSIDQVADLFPKADVIDMRSSTDSRSATVLFNDAKTAAEALQANQDAKISRKKIIVTYCERKTKSTNVRRIRKIIYEENKKRSKPSTGPAAKKAKMEVYNDDDDDFDNE